MKRACESKWLKDNFHFTLSLSTKGSYESSRSQFLVVRPSLHLLCVKD